MMSGRGHLRWLGTGVGATGLDLAAGLTARAVCVNPESGPRSCTGETLGFGLLRAAMGGLLGQHIGRAINR
jgi:hypothetical protein